MVRRSWRVSITWNRADSSADEARSVRTTRWAIPAAAIASRAGVDAGSAEPGAGPVAAPGAESGSAAG